MTKMRKLFGAVVASALAFGGLSAAPASAAAPAPTFEFLDLGMPITDTWDMAEINDTLYFRGTESGTQKLFKLDATDKAVAIDTSAVGPVQSIIGAFEEKLYIETEDQDGNSIAMMYDGTTLTKMPTFPGYNPDFEDGLEYNGKWYFEAEDESDGNNYIYRVDGATVEKVNVGTANAPVYLESADLLGVFDGKLMLGANDPTYNGGTRTFSVWDGTTLTAKNGTIDYQGTPTLRKFPYPSAGLAFQDAFYFGSTFEEANENSVTWTGGGSGYALFKMSKAGVVTRVDPVEARKDLTFPPENFWVLNGNLYFEENNGRGGSAIRKITATGIELVVSDLVNPTLWEVVTYKNKSYFWVNSSVASFDGTTVTQLYQGNRFWNGKVAELLNDVILYRGPDPDGTDYNVVYAFDGTTEIKIPNSSIDGWPWSRATVKGAMYLMGYNKTAQNWQMAKLTAGTYVPPVTPVTPPTKVDTDNPALGSLSETKTFKGTRGAISFADGSGFDIDAKGKMYSRVKSKYLTTVAGSFVVTYKVGAATKTWTCKIAKYGSTKKLKALPRNAILYKSKQSCQLPAAVLKAMKTGSVTIRQNVTMTRYYATTAKTKTPAGKAIRPLVRKMTVKIGAVIK
jgi:hypothetical protein